jgi:hypothetical protein
MPAANFLQGYTGEQSSTLREKAGDGAAGLRQAAGVSAIFWVPAWGENTKSTVNLPGIFVS